MQISVVTVVRNDRAVIDTVQSVLTQRGPKIHCVVVDGASTDGTLQALRAFGRRISLKSEPDKGIYEAMNKGLRRASGEVVGFLNAGDVYASPTALAPVANAFAKDRDLCATWAALDIVDGGGKLKRHWPAQDYEYGSFSRGWMPSHPTFYARRQALLDQGGFDTRYRLAADYDLMLRVMEANGFKGKALSQTLVRMRSGGASQRSLGAWWRHNKEAWTAAQRAGLFKGNIWSFLGMKVGRKLPQLWIKS